MQDIPKQAFVELAAVYARIDEALALFAHHCVLCGNCCDFADIGHMLYVTDLEAAWMLESSVKPLAHQSRDGKCPFQHLRRCAIREHRAMGCRIYCCDRAYRDERHEIYERFLKQVRDIEARYRLEHSYQAITQIVTV
ncbi:MAG: hypothetical protein V1899_07655 [Planctomycetota bacterium]